MHAVRPFPVFGPYRASLGCLSWLYDSPAASDLHLKTPGRPRVKVEFFGVTKQLETKYYTLVEVGRVLSSDSILVCVAGESHFAKRPIGIGIAARASDHP
jgi:hypothetical protein